MPARQAIPPCGCASDSPGGCEIDSDDGFPILLEPMKLYLHLLASLSLISAPCLRAADRPAAGSDSEPKKVLMIGNSLTYTYGIPSILERLAADSKHELKVTAHVAGGKDLDWHSTNPSGHDGLTAPQQIEKGGFDLVILQDSGRHLVKEDGRVTFDRSVSEYYKAITGKSMRTMLYMAHPTNKEVDAQFLKPIIAGYSAKADELGVPCAPVAIAFIRCNEKLPKIALIDAQADRKYALSKCGTHQSPFGSYLAACTLYAAIYNRSPVGIPFHSAFDAKTEIPFDVADARAAQEIAWQVWQEYQKEHPRQKR